MISFKHRNHSWSLVCTFRQESQDRRLHMHGGLLSEYHVYHVLTPTYPPPPLPALKRQQIQNYQTSIDNTIQKVFLLISVNFNFKFNIKHLILRLARLSVTFVDSGFVYKYSYMGNFVKEIKTLLRLPIKPRTFLKAYIQYVTSRKKCEN